VFDGFSGHQDRGVDVLAERTNTRSLCEKVSLNTRAYSKMDWRELPVGN
jgi:hypothetical protein